jgi:hypothetical protein
MASDSKRRRSDFILENFRFMENKCGGDRRIRIPALGFMVALLRCNPFGGIPMGGFYCSGYCLNVDLGRLKRCYGFFTLILLIKSIHPNPRSDIVS